MAEENDSESVTQDNISSIKSICESNDFYSTEVDKFHIVQLLEIEPFEALRPVLELLLKETDQNKQRAAAGGATGRTHQAPFHDEHTARTRSPLAW